jgi:hypothetical protein
LDKGSIQALGIKVQPAGANVLVGTQQVGRAWLSHAAAAVHLTLRVGQHLQPRRIGRSFQQARL